MLSASVVFAIAGVIALLFGIIGGGIRAREVEIPYLPSSVRLVTILIGLAFLGLSIWWEFERPLLGDRIPTIQVPTLAPQNTTLSELTSTSTTEPTPASTSMPTDTPIPQTEVSGPEALYAKLITAKTWNLVLQEPFDDNENNWTLWNNENEQRTIATQIDQGVLRMRLQAKGTRTPHWDFAPLNTYSDFYYALKTKRVRSPSEGANQALWGIIFRRQGNNFYALLLNDVQEYTLYLHQGEEWIPLLGPTRSTLINVNRSNELAVVADGDEIAFYINGNAIDQIEDDTLLNGNVGIYVGTINLGDDVTIEFDDFELRQKP